MFLVRLFKWGARRPRLRLAFCRYCVDGRRTFDDSYPEGLTQGDKKLVIRVRTNFLPQQNLRTFVPGREIRQLLLSLVL